MNKKSRRIGYLFKNLIGGIMNNKQFVKEAIKRFLKKKFNYEMNDDILVINDLITKMESDNVSLHLNIDLKMTYRELMELWKN